jgi:hypothetical protein
LIVIIYTFISGLIDGKKGGGKKAAEGSQILHAVILVPKAFGIEPESTGRHTGGNRYPVSLS